MLRTPRPPSWPLVVYLNPSAAHGPAPLLALTTPVAPDRSPRRSSRSSLPGRTRRRTPGVTAFLDRMEAAWQTRDLDAWLALREFSGPEERSVEEATLRAAFASDEVVFSFLRRPTPRPGETRLAAEVQLFTATEPKARVAFWTLVAERRAAGWAIVSRQEVSQMDGLVHLAHRQQAFRVRDFALRFPDFELRLEDGTLFSSAPEIGPTLAHLRGQRTRPLHALAPGGARAAASVRRHDVARSRRELGLRAHAPRGLPARAGRARVRAGARPGRAPRARRRRSSGTAPSAASSSTRRCRARRGG